MEKNKIYLGKNIEIIKGFPDNSFDSIVTDPPYELGFMGKSWDSTGIAYDVDFWKECLRVLKHGGYLLSFSGTRTYHRMVCAIEDAGFEIRDMIEWVYGSGFPKSLDISKAIDKQAGKERKIVGKYKLPNGQEWNLKQAENSDIEHKGGTFTASKTRTLDITAPATVEAQEWDGWGTALKPAHEPIVVARKPLSEKTVAENVLKWGAGGLNIDECRVAVNPEVDDMLRTVVRKERESEAWKQGSGFKNENNHLTGVPINGRFPANFIHDGSDEVLRWFPSTKSGQPQGVRNTDGGYGKKYGSIPVTGFGDEGSAARFFKTCEFTEEDSSFLYCGKTSKQERNLGCFDKGNVHPTVKPIALMKYLIRLVTHKNGIVLDPFAGSGTTLIAAVELDINFVGIDEEKEYVDIANARIEYWRNNKHKIPVKKSEKPRINTVEKQTEKIVKKEKTVKVKEKNAQSNQAELLF